MIKHEVMLNSEGEEAFIFIRGSIGTLKPKPWIKDGAPRWRLMLRGCYLGEYANPEEAEKARSSILLIMDQVSRRWWVEIDGKVVGRYHTAPEAYRAYQGEVK